MNLKEAFRFQNQINKLMLEERQQLSQAKATISLDFDGEVGLNAKRQEIASIFPPYGADPLL